jgi:hypothetical protein
MAKQWVVETLEMPKRYYSFTKNKWHFIVLDSTQLNPEGGYIAYIDPEQLTGCNKNLNNQRINSFALYHISRSFLFVPVYSLIKRKQMAI